MAAAAALFRYSLPLRRPLPVRGAGITRRDGLLLRLEDAAGRCAWGDIAPLPGFSPDTLEEAETALAPRLEAPECFAIPPPPEWPPAVRAGIGMARVALRAAAGGMLPARCLHSGAADHVPVAALLGEVLAAAPEHAAAAVRAGHSVLKLKAGRGDPGEEAGQILRIAAELPSDARLRIDANRAWDWDTAVRFGRAAAHTAIAFIEEPLADPAGLAEYPKAAGLPIALDESLAPWIAALLDHGPEALASAAPWLAPALRAARALVLKPTLCGEFERLIALPERLPEFRGNLVISAMFESDLGAGMLAQLAAALGPAAAPAGLDTLDWLDGGLLATPLVREGGEIRFGAGDWRGDGVIRKTELRHV